MISPLVVIADTHDRRLTELTVSRCDPQHISRPSDIAYPEIGISGGRVGVTTDGSWWPFCLGQEKHPVGETRRKPET
jgi:hypothetical protein